jgi:hypothetical protein
MGRTVMTNSASILNFFLLIMSPSPFVNENPVGNFLPRSKIVFHYLCFELNILLSNYCCDLSSISLSDTHT